MGRTRVTNWPCGVKKRAAPRASPPPPGATTSTAPVPLLGLGEVEGVRVGVRLPEPVVDTRGAPVALAPVALAPAPALEALEGLEGVGESEGAAGRGERVLVREGTRM